MSFQAKLYANRHGKAENPPRKNKFQVTGDVEQAQAIADGDKAAIKELLSAVARSLEETDLEDEV
jgi:hypothetical protein